MFAVKYQYQGPLGEIKSSYAAQRSYFENKTTGIALKFVATGQEHYLIQNKPISVAAGELILLPHDQPYESQTSTNKAITNGICIDLETNFVLERCPSLLERELWFALPFRSPHLFALHRTFAQFYQGNGPDWKKLDYEQLLLQLTQQITDLVHIIRPIHEVLKTKARKVDTQKQLLLKLLNAKSFIHQHYCQSIKLAELAQFTGLSQYYFLRLFKACFQQSPLQLQLELRMQKATILMQQPNNSLSHIALQLGYADLAAFSNQFKQYYQQSPSQFRKTFLG